jgi:phenylpyruvate tautomerase PptA (4-oxalocrotonate tautomerase family)
MQVDVLIEYAESDKWIVAKFMNEAMEEFDR